jgi:hypothetical protein
MSRVARRRADDRSPDAEDDPGLRALSESTRRLIAGLKAGAGEPALRDVVAAYVGCAASVGISRARIHDALEFLVHDHAVPDDDRARPGPTAGRRSAADQLRARHQATAHVLELVLRLASRTDTGAVRQLREAV